MVGGRKPGIIAYIHSTARNRREFERWCDRNGADARPVEYVRNDLPAAYEVVGALETLERLTDHPVVREWHLIVNVRVPHIAGGAAEMTVNAERAARRAKMHRPDREAVEETERRARLPRDDRERLELAELLERERALAQ
jgi:hypothetical protein